jgi:predicted ABC-type ATPase
MKKKTNIIVGNNNTPTKLEAGQVIINKKATEENLDKLVEINGKEKSPEITTDGTDGGLLKGKPHYDKNGNSLGGIPAVVVGGKKVELEGDEFVVKKSASRKHWKELSKINQSAGNGVPILPPDGATDEDPEEFKDGGNVIDFNPNHLPNKWITEYAQEIKKNHPEVWKLGGNIFGNEAFNNLERVRKRGYWLDSEEWMYIKWRSYVARHRQDFRINGVIAMLKWCDKVDKGWGYMKTLIEKEIAKQEKKKNPSAFKLALKNKTAFKDGGNISKTNDSCQVLDKNGNPAIDDKSLRKMEKCIMKLTQTKDLHLNANGKYKLARRKLHKKIIDEFKKNAVCITKGQPIAILMGGSPASGKSSFLKRYRPFLLQEEILKVDADEIRAKLPEYKGYNATQTHQETKDIVTTLISDRNIGVPCDFDLIYDGTMNNVRSYKPLIELLRSRNYKIFIVYMDKVPKDVIMQRMKDRYLKTGRFVPAEVVDDFFNKGTSAFEELKPLVDGYLVIDGSNQDYDIIEKGGMQLPEDRAYSKLGQKISAAELEKIEYKRGGNLDKKDSVELDIPLLIRVLEFAREDIKSDPELHHVVERLIEIRDKGVLTMEDYDFIADLKKKEKFSEIERKYATGGNVLLAPNGKPSNLTPEQYKLVRTPAFKKWFGDWENDPKNASKVVDENGEPLVCYHGSQSNFTVFDKSKGGKSNNIASVGYWFTPLKNFAENFAESVWYGEKKLTIYAVFLSIKNIKKYSSEDNSKTTPKLRENIEKLKLEAKKIAQKWDFGYESYENVNAFTLAKNGRINEENLEYYSTITPTSSLAIKDGKKVKEITDEIKKQKDQLSEFYFSDSYQKFRTDIHKTEGGDAETANTGGLGMSLKNQNTVEKYKDQLIDNGFGGILIENTKFDAPVAGGLNDQYIAFEPNQIKLADGTNATFDPNNADIRFETGGTVLLAPNGKPSNLTPEQYKLVRTPAFKKWFGDWENDPENASKVVDSNGEPLVVYHGTASEFNIFKIGRTGGIFFSNNKNSAGRFSGGDLKREGTNPKILECFLNIRKYYDTDTNDGNLVDSYYKQFFASRPFIKNDSKKNILKDKFKKYFMDLVFFGIVNEEPKQVLTSFNYDGIVMEADNNSITYIAFEPNQIKLADGNNTTFDPNNDDIRFEKGGEIKFTSTKSATIKIGSDLYKIQYRRNELGNTDKNVWFADVISKNEKEVDGRLCFEPEYYAVIYGFSFKEVENLVFECFKQNKLWIVLIDDSGNEKEVIHVDGKYDPNSDNSFYKQGGRTTSQTPAPSKERIYGSQKNKPKSSKDSSSAESIKFDEKTLTSIENKLKEHNDQHPDVKVNLATAKAVVRRGMGAYSSSHRPTISSGKPNSRVAWGLARLNAFLYKAINGESKSGKYSQDNDLLDELSIAHDKFKTGGEIERKQKQLEIINRTNPAPNEYNTWIRSVEDIKTAEEVFQIAFEDGAMYPDFQTEDMTEALESGYVTIYSSYPIKEGVFVTPSKINALEYAGGKGGKVFSKKVQLKDIAWIDESEGQFAPAESFKTGGEISEKNKNGNCYEVAGRIVIYARRPDKTKIEYIGTPYLVHAQVTGQGAIEGVKYGHAWIEDDVFVYDYSNNRKLEIPKALYYKAGKIIEQQPIYFKYTFAEAKSKMKDTEHYGSWDLITESGL